MPEAVLVRDLAVVMAVSGAVTALFHRLRQPVVLGYLLAGVVIGPHTPRWILAKPGRRREERAAPLIAELPAVGRALPFLYADAGRVYEGVTAVHAETSRGGEATPMRPNVAEVP